ncbi:short-chain dehydrogenase [Pandoraea pnomenusa 3kgm]|nr:short-chain dehydrogenase [Pandoraea pnomenusa 3kgm]
MAGKICIVTGAASGIGRAIATRLAESGASVVIADVTTEVIEGGEPTAEMLRHAGYDVTYRRTDVSSEGDVNQLVQDVVARYGKLDVLVNNACVRHARPLLEMEESEWNRIINVNLGGVFRTCKAAVAQMIQQDEIDEVRGRIVNLSSQHGIISAPGDIAYGTSKAGVAYLTKQIATDYAAQGIVCNAVAPGKIQTGAGGRAVDPGVLDRAYRRTPWPRLGKPMDVANAVLFLCTSDATFITGAELMVDGGWMAA